MAKHLLKFYKGVNQPDTAAAGAIWFSTTDRTIRVYTGSTWEKYAGLVDASWNATDKLLTITSAAGATTQLDLSDCASASDISAKLTTINNTLNAHNTRINAAQAAAEAAQAAAEAADAKAVKEAEDRASAITGVEGLISAEAATARAAEKANADAAKAADDKAAEAQTYAEGVNTALGQEVTRAKAEEARIVGLVSAEESRAKAEEERLAGLISSAASGATTEVKEADGNTHVKVAPSTGANGQKIYTISEVDIASAQGLASEIARATDAEDDLAERITALDAAETGRVSVLESKVAALASATHFLGVKAELPASANNGDIVIVGNKEYVWDDNVDGTNVLGKAGWVELGDVSDEVGRISALESWKTTASQTIEANTAAIESNDGDITALQNRAKTIEDNITNNIATKKELADEKSALNTLITTNGNAIKALQEKDDEFDEWIDSHTTAFTTAFNDLSTEVGTKASAKSVTDLTARVATNEGNITNINTEIDHLEAATGCEGEYAPKTDANYINNAASLKDADNKLDAAIKVVAQSVEAKNVDAQGDAYVQASAANNKVTVAAVVADSIGDGSATALATVKAVHDALAWADFS